MRWAMLLVAMLLLAACTREPVDLHSRYAAARTEPMTVADWIIQGRNDFLLVDLRGKSAFDAKHIPGAIQLEQDKVDDERVVASFPDYKTLVFYDASGQVKPEQLAPVFQRGLHVMVLQGGFEGWEQQVLTAPEEADGPAAAKRVAVSKYFRGESALGTPKELKEISAEQYIKQPTLPLQQQEAAPFQMEGC